MGLLASTMRARLGDASDYTDEIRAAADRWGVDPNVIAAIVTVESSGNPDAQGAAGEIGLMQVMPSTGAQVEPGADLWNPWTNIDVGTHYLADQLRRYGGDLRNAVSAYNAGHATPQNQGYVDKVFSAIGSLFTSAAPDDPVAPDTADDTVTTPSVAPWLLLGGLAVAAFIFTRRR